MRDERIPKDFCGEANLITALPVLWIKAVWYIGNRLKEVNRLNNQSQWKRVPICCLFCCRRCCFSQLWNLMREDQQSKADRGLIQEKKRQIHRLGSTNRKKMLWKYKKKFHVIGNPFVRWSKTLLERIRIFLWSIKGLSTWRVEDPWRWNNFSLGLHAAISVRVVPK